MDFAKLKLLLPKRIALDLGFANSDTIRVSGRIGDDNSWYEFTPSSYKNEEELALSIISHLAK